MRSRRVGRDQTGEPETCRRGPRSNARCEQRDRDPLHHYRQALPLRPNGDSAARQLATRLAIWAISPASLRRGAERFTTSRRARCRNLPARTSAATPPRPSACPAPPPPPTLLSAAAAGQPAGQLEGLGEVGEVDLDGDLLPPRPHPDLVAEADSSPSAASRIASPPRRSSSRPRPPSRLWLAGQLNPVLGLANRPAALRRVAGEAAAGVVAADRRAGRGRGPR